MMFKTALAALAVAAFFFYFAGAGLKAWFVDDQLMNLYFASDKGVAELARQPERPVSTLAMRGLWELFGFHPRPYRVVCFALLLLNLVLAAGLAWVLSESGVTTVLFAVLFSYHAMLTDLYFSTGTLYDILCFTFSFAALLWYAWIRGRGRAPGWWDAAGIGLLSALAIGSKEMAIALPPLLALIEWLYGDRRHWRVPIVSAAVCLAFTVRLLTSSAMQANSAYHLAYTAQALWANWGHYLGLLFYQSQGWSPLAGKVALAAVVALAVLLGRREAWFACAVALVTPLPVLLIDPRNLYVFYIPYFGFCLLAASALARMGGRLRQPAWLAVVLAMVLTPAHLAIRDFANGWYYAQERILCEPGKAIRRTLPPLQPGSRILFVDDPFPVPPEMEYQLFYYVALISNDHTIRVDRLKAMQTPPPESQWGDYAAVFRLTQNEMIRLL